MYTSSAISSMDCNTLVICNRLTKTIIDSKTHILRMNQGANTTEIAN